MSLSTTPLAHTMVDDISTPSLYVSELQQRQQQQQSQIDTLTSPKKTLSKTLESSSLFSHVNTTPTSANSIDSLCSEPEDHLDEDIEDTHYRRRKFQIKSEIQQDLVSECDSEPEIEWHLILESMNKEREEKLKAESQKSTPPQVKFPIEFSRRERKTPIVPTPRPNFLQNIPPPPQMMMTNPLNFPQYPNPYFYPFNYHSWMGNQAPPLPSSFVCASPYSEISTASSPSMENESINKKRNYSELENSKEKLAAMTVYVSNIPKNLNTMEVLTKMLKKFGNIVDLKIYQEQNTAQVSYLKQKEAVKAFNIIGKLKNSLFNSQDVEVSCPAAANFEKPSIQARNKKPDLRQTVQQKLTEKLQNLIANRKKDLNFEESLKMIKQLLSNLRNESYELGQFKDQLKIFEIQI